MRIHHCLLASLLVLGAASVAVADDAADAAAHAATGKKAFADQRYPEAIAEFRAANALAPDPKLLYAIAQAQRLAGDCAGAIESYEAFIATKADPKLSEYSAENIKRCREDLANAPPPTEPTPVEPTPVEPTPVAPTPEPAPVLVPPGPGPGPIDGGGRPWYRDWIGDGLVVGGVVGIAVGTSFVISGRSSAQKANDATDYASFLAARDAASSALTRQRIGVGAAIVGAGLVVGGILHYKLGASGHEVRVGAVPTAGGAAVYAGVDL